MAKIKQILGLHDLAMEEAVLGALVLQGKTVFSEIELLLREEHFSDVRHKIIFNAIKQLHENGEGYDMLLLRSYLKKSNNLDDVGGAVKIAQLTERVASTANIRFHAKVLIECYMRRKMVEMCENFLGQAEHTQCDPFQEIDRFMLAFGELQSVGTSQSVEACDAGEVDNYMKTITTTQTKIDVGMSVQEMYKPGLGHLSIAAGRPAMGKSAYMTSQIANIIKQNEQTNEKTMIACFSLEMPKHEIYNRINSNMTYIYGSKFQDNKLTVEERNVVITNQARLKGLYVFEDRNLRNIRSKLIEMKQVAKRDGYAKMICYIDYIQLMEIDGKFNRVEELSKIANGLKKLAKELNIHICALAQIGRAAEARGGDKKPQLSDLKESGGIEEAADVVKMLYRPWYYGFKTDEEGKPTNGLATIIVAKNRHGVTGEEAMKFEGQYSAFRNVIEPQPITIEPQKDYFANAAAQASDLQGNDNDLPF